MRELRYRKMLVLRDVQHAQLDRLVRFGLAGSITGWRCDGGQGARDQIEHGYINELPRRAGEEGCYDGADFFSFLGHGNS